MPALTLPLGVFGRASNGSESRAGGFVRRTGAWFVFTLATAHAGFGCARVGSGSAAPFADRAVATERRVRAIAAWGVDQPDAAEGTESLAAAATLSRLLWSDREPRAVRLAALGALANRAPRVLWAGMDRHLTGVGDPVVVAAVAGRATDDGVTSAVGPLVRRWARPRGDAVFGATAAGPATPRAEATAVTRITGRSETRALRDVLQHDPVDANAAAAWGLLTRHTQQARHALSARNARTSAPGRSTGTGPTSTTEDRFDAVVWAARAADHPPASAAARALARWAQVLDEWPVNGEQVRGLTAWADADLPVVRPAGLALRHLPLLSAGGRRQDGSQAALMARLAASTHVPRRIDGTSDASPGFVPDRLSPADALLLHAVLDALATPDVVAALFAQADADHADRRREHGGGLLHSGKSGENWKAESYASARQAGDHVYATRSDLLAALYRRGLAHYHFHAQRIHHAAYAGPGPGDLDFAAHSGLLCLTVTFFAADHLNVDATLPDRSVIDLGSIRR